MNRILLLICFSISALNADIVGNDPITFPALLQVGPFTGSGVFVRMSNSVYLVTAKHVLFSEPRGTNPPPLLAPQAIVTCFSSAVTTNVSRRAVLLQLDQLNSAGEVRYSTNRDVALVRVLAKQTEDSDTILPGVIIITPQAGAGLNAIGRDLLAEFDKTEAGNDVYVFGFPTSVTEKLAGRFDITRPWLRKASSLQQTPAVALSFSTVRCTKGIVAAP